MHTLNITVFVTNEETAQIEDIPTVVDLNEDWQDPETMQSMIHDYLLAHDMDWTWWEAEYQVDSTEKGVELDIIGRQWASSSEL